MLIAKQPNDIRQFVAIAIFIGTGATSVYLFFLITGLAIFQGTTEYFTLVVTTFAWILIFPVWIMLFAVAMWVLNTLSNTK